MTTCHTHTHLQSVICSHAGVRPERRLVWQQHLAPVFAQHCRRRVPPSLVERAAFALRLWRRLQHEEPPEEPELPVVSYKEHAAGLVFGASSIRRSPGNKAAQPKHQQKPRDGALFFFVVVLFDSLSAIYRVGSSGSIAVLICFQSLSSAPFLKSKIDMFPAAAPPTPVF